MRREDVRGALDALASEVPAPGADAASAMARGRRRVRRRRLMLAGVVAVLVAIVASVGAIASRDTSRTTTLHHRDLGRPVAGARSSQIVAPTALEAWKCLNPIEYTDDGGRTWRATRLPGTRASLCTAVAGGTAWVLTGRSDGPGTHLLRIRDGGDKIDSFDLPRASQEGATPPTFLDADHGWLRYEDAALGEETTYRTSDGGATWIAVTKRKLGPISFSSPEIGWSTDGTNILGTSDGGVTWRVVHPAGGRVFRVVATPVGAVAWAGTIVREAQYVPFFEVTSDGGRTWTRRKGPAGFELPYGNNAFNATDAAHWQLTSGPRLSTTGDGGRTWAALPNLVKIDGYGVTTMSFPSAQVGWITSEKAIVLRTIDGGKTWGDVTEGAAPPPTPTTILPAYTGPVPIPLAFVSPTEGWLCSTPTLEYTTDAGVTWKNVSVPSHAPAPPHYQHPLCAAVPGGQAWLLTASTDYDREQLIHISAGGAKIETFAFPQLEVDISSLVFADAQRGWAILDSPSGELLATTDGGRTWNFDLGQRTKPVLFSTSTDGWGAEYPPGAEIAHTTDGGRTWRYLSLPAPAPIITQNVGVAPAAAVGDTVVAFGSNPSGSLTQLFFDVSTDAGRTWRLYTHMPPSTFGTTEPMAFSAVDADHWQLSESNRLWTTSDRGQTWTAVAEFAGISQIDDVHFLTPDIGFVSATGIGEAAAGTVVRQTTDGGATWSTADIQAPPMGRHGAINFPGGIFGCPTHPLAAPPPGDPPAGLIDAAVRYVEEGPYGFRPVGKPVAYRVGTERGEFWQVFNFQIPSCGPDTVAASWVVELYGAPGSGAGGSTPQAQIVLASSTDGWHVFGRYH